VSASNWVHLDFDEILRETDKALLVRFPDGEEEWVPISQISDEEDYRVGDQDGTISVSEWLARQKGWL
jgi:hypothetical protein